MDIGGGGGALCIAASAGLASPPERMAQPVGCLRVLSSVVVAGCVHLLMVVRAVPVAVGQQREQQGPAAHTGTAAAAAAAVEATSFASYGGQPSADCNALDEDGVSYAVHGAVAYRHVTVERARGCVALSGGGGDGEGEGGAGLAGAEAGEHADDEAWGLAVQREVEAALRGVEMGTVSGLGASAGGCRSGGEGEHTSGGNRAGFVWPPAVPVAAAAADPAALDSPAFLGTGGQGGAACSGRGVEVALVVPRGVLRGHRAVRCVVAGGAGAKGAAWAARPGGVGEAGDRDCTVWLSNVPGVGAADEEQGDEAGQEADHGGWAEGEGEECLGCGLQQHQLHADVELELPKGQELEGSGRAGKHGSSADGSWGDADGYVSVRWVSGRGPGPCPFIVEV